MSAGQGGKKSWRQSEKEPAPAETPPAADAAPAPPVSKDSPPPKPSASPKRFRGGKSSVEVDKQSPRWFRLLLPISALVLIVVALIALIILIDPFRVDPELLAWSVTDYQDEAPAIPLNAFAVADVNAIRKGGFDLSAMEQFSIEGLQTKRGFGEVFPDEQGGVRDIEKTVVVYVSAHGISRGKDALLLVVDRPSGQFTWQAFPVRKVLEAMAACKSPNKVLILDATRIEADFELGLLGNEFVDLVQRDFEEIKDTIQGRLWVILSSDSNERSWTSRSHGHSVFGAAVAYALCGAADVDTGGLEPGSPADLYISAQELFDFVNEKVSTWAPANRDGATQNPVLLRNDEDEDFHIVRVSASEPSDSLAKGAKKEEEDEEKAAAPSPSSDEPLPLDKLVDLVGKKTEEIDAQLVKFENKEIERSEVETSLIAVLDSLWLLRDQLGSDKQTEAALAWLPNEFTQLEEGLLRVELRLLGGEILKSAVAIQGLADLGTSLADKALAASQPPSTPWTIFHPSDLPGKPAEVDEAKKAEADQRKKRRTQLDKIAKEKDAAADREAFLKEEPSPQAEAALLHALVREYPQPEQWAAAQPTISSAYDARLAAEQRCATLDPFLLATLRPELDEIDRLRRAGEQSLLLGQFNDARAKLADARRAYDALQDRIDRTRENWQDVRETVRCLVPMIRWIGATPARVDSRAEDVRRFEELVAQIREFRSSDPNANTKLEALAERCRDFKNSCETFVEEAFKGDWQIQRAAMELDFVDVQRRARLRKLLLDRQDDDPVGEIHGGSEAGAFPPPNPYPLAGLVELLEGPKELVEKLRPFESLGPLSKMRMEEDDSQLRLDRADAGEAVLRVLYEAMDQRPTWTSTDAPNRADLLWLVEARQLALAPLRVKRPDYQAEVHDRFFQQLDQQYRQEWLQWQESRFEKDNEHLPGNVYSDAVDVLAGLTGKESAPALEPPSLVNRSGFKVPPEGTLDDQIQVTRIPSNASAAVLVLDWERSNDRIQFYSENGRKEADFNHRILLDLQRNADGDAWTAPIRITRLSPENQNSPPPRVFAWLRVTVDGVESVYWLPMSVQFQAAKGKDGELVLMINDTEVTRDIEGKIEQTFYPNQSLPMSVKVRQNVAGPFLVDVLLESSEKTVTLGTVEFKEAISKELLSIPLPAKDFSFPIGADGEVTISLKKQGADTEALDSFVLQCEKRAWTVAFTPGFQVDWDKRSIWDIKVERKKSATTNGDVPLVFRVEGNDGEVLSSLPSSLAANESVTAPLKELDLPKVGSEFIVSVDVADVPSAFRFRIIDGDISRIDTPGVEFFRDNPVEGGVFPIGTNPAVALLVHGVRFSDSTAKLFLKVSREVETPMYCGRGSQMSLGLNGKGDQLELKWIVGPVKADLSEMWISGRQTIQARLEVDKETRASASRDVYLLAKDKLPKLQFTAPAAGDEYVLNPDQSVTVTVVLTGDDRELAKAIAGIDFGFSRSPKFAEKSVDALVQNPREYPFQEGATATFQIVPKDADTLSKNQLWNIVARPRIDYTPVDEKQEPVSAYGPDSSVAIQVVKPPPPADPTMPATTPPSKPKPWTLKGKVKSNIDIFKATVKAEGPGKVESAETNVNGEFTLRGDVPGPYKISATRDISAPKLATPTPVDVTIKEGENGPITIIVSEAKAGEPPPSP